MKEIKFRAWHRKRRVIYHNVCFDSYGYPMQLKGPGIDVLDFVRRDDCELMQFIGLRDKNGEEIYEGDIIKWISGNKGYYFEGTVIKHNKYDRSGWGMLLNNQKRYNVFQSWFIDDEIIIVFPLNCEIIGNIYENPKLGVINNEIG